MNDDEIEKSGVQRIGDTVENDRKPAYLPNTNFQWSERQKNALTFIKAVLRIE